MASVSGLILAAGRGSRMGNATATRPKGLTEVAGQALIEWQSAALSCAGVSPVVAIGGYKAEALRDVIEVAHINEAWEQTNMVMSLRCADALLCESDVCVSYSDIVYHPAHVLALTSAEADIAICYDRAWLSLWQLRFDDPLSDAESFKVEGDFLTDIGRSKVRLDEINGQYMGLIKLRPEGWRSVMELTDRLPPDVLQKLDMTSLLSRLIAEDVRIQAIPVEGRWCEVDSQSDLDVYTSMIDAVDHTGTDWAHDWRWSKVGIT